VNLKIINGRKISEGYFHEDLKDSSSSSSCFSQGWIHKQEPLNIEKKRWKPKQGSPDEKKRRKPIKEQESPDSETYKKQIFGMVDGPIRVFENKFKRQKSQVSSIIISPDRESNVMISPGNVISPERSRPLKSKRTITPDSLKISSSQTKS
jgi:hypothetical protein